jgi:hypothetical protein
MRFRLTVQKGPSTRTAHILTINMKKQKPKKESSINRIIHTGSATPYQGSSLLMQRPYKKEKSPSKKQQCEHFEAEGY